MVDFKKKKAKDEDAGDSVEQVGDVNVIRGALSALFKADVSKKVQPIVFSTGILSMDLVLGTGGLVGGRIVDISGWEGSGKTLTLMTIAGYIQRCTKLDKNGKTVNKVVAIVDAEGTYDEAFARSAGVNTDTVIVVRSTEDKVMHGEDFFEAIRLLVRNGVDFIIVDSCPALVPNQVMSNGVGQGQKATNAQLMSAGLQAILPFVNSSTNSVVAFINQMRGKPMSKPHEATEDSTGGFALPFYASYIFKVSFTEPIIKNVLLDDGTYTEKRVGVSVGIKLTKNKTAVIPPTLPSKSWHFGFDIYTDQFIDDEGLAYSRGVDIVKDAIDVAVRTGVITQNSSWYTFGDIKTNGLTEMVKRLRAQPELIGQIRAQVLGIMGTQGGLSIPNTNEV